MEKNTLQFWDLVLDKNLIDGPRFRHEPDNFFCNAKEIAQVLLLYFKKQKNIHDPIMIVNPQESKCRIMKSRKKSMKKSTKK